ncbi:MAG: DegT/DnrJ/EryC1/StrS family aminotransferase [Candidatus Bathyarchaeota archaeon]|nr:DegT/DnrJ/EryC1/StrS family aminotransferase [Candidatus Bathyarchaeota archaeon]
MIPINIPTIGEEEIDAVTKVLRSGILTSSLGAGPNVTEFEKAYAKFAGVKHAIAVNSGTAALHAALAAAGINRGDEVILPSFTFVATAEAVVLAGGKPVFADIDPKTYSISLETAKKVFTDRCKAIVPVDLYGLPVDVAPIKEFAVDHDLAVVEDCAQSHGAEYKGKPAGAFADAACWSLYAAKNIGTGEGGVVTTDDDDIAELVRMVRTHGEKTKYSSLMLGTNYRMTEIEAAIGRVQLKRLPEFLEKRSRNAHKLNNLLCNNDRLVLPVESEKQKPSWYLYTVRINDATETQRNQIITEMHSKDIGAEAYYPIPVHQMPYYQKEFGAGELPETMKAAKQVISLPIQPRISEEQIEFIATAFLNELQKLF